MYSGPKINKLAHLHAVHGQFSGYTILSHDLIFFVKLQSNISRIRRP